MPGLRGEFASMKNALDSDSDDDDDVGKSKIMKAKNATKEGADKLYKPSNAKGLDALRGQKGASTWKTSLESKETQGETVIGLRAGTRVATEAGRSAGEELAARKMLSGAASIDTEAHTRYGERMKEQKAYQGPEIVKKIVEKAIVYEKPAPQPVPAHVMTANDLIEEMNTLRLDPAAYAKKLEILIRPYYDGKTAYPPRGVGEAHATLEGIEAVDEAISFLKRSAKTSKLKIVPGLMTAANDYIETAKTEEHPNCTAAQHGRVEGAVYDLIARRCLYADEAIAQILIADGDKTRRARRRLLEPKLTRCGAAVFLQQDCKHAAADGTIAVITCAQTFRAYPKPGFHSYQGKIPIADDAFLELLLALPEPLPNDILARIKQGHKVDIDYKQSSATITISEPSGAQDTIQVDDISNSYADTRQNFDSST
mmetsp:Transcript_4884/g.6912  ORF Transcript_4884/g.6912 Transcript_4884/m.6912 type:complete len:427 (+) Transcript_4884:43-1323(+)